MRMRFWATIRSPAFSISALIAPVRLRAVASGLIIEKVRSIAIISSLKSADGSCGAYIGAIGERQAAAPPMALTAPNPRRRPCYANSRLLQLLRLRWARPRWRRLPPPPGAAMAGTAVGTTAGLGRAPDRRWRSGLWLRRLLCAAIGPDALGSPLAAGQWLLLSPDHSANGPGREGRGCLQVPVRGNRMFSCNFYDKPMQLTPEGKPFQPRRLGSASHRLRPMG